MGARTAKTVDEIDQIKRRVESNIAALDGRLPQAIQSVRKAAVAAGGVSGLGVALTVLRKIRKRSKKKKSRLSKAANQVSAPTPSPTSSNVTVNVIPPAASNLAALAFVAWAGLKVYRAVQAKKALEDSSITRLPTNRPD